MAVFVGAATSGSVVGLSDEDVEDPSVPEAVAPGLVNEGGVTGEGAAVNDDDEGDGLTLAVEDDVDKVEKEVEVTVTDEAEDDADVEDVETEVFGDSDSPPGADGGCLKLVDVEVVV